MIWYHTHTYQNKITLSTIPFFQHIRGYLEITINLRNCPFQIDKIFISFLISFLATYFAINNDELEIFFRKKINFLK